MIKVYLPENFHELPDINGIYDELAKTIFNKICNKKVSYSYHEEKRTFDSENDIKHFLIASDFYNYIFEEEKNFWSDFKKIIHWNTKISNIFCKNPKSKTVKEFRTKYSMEEYEVEYEELRAYKNLNVKNYCLKNVHPEFEDKKEVCKFFSYEIMNKKDRHIILDSMDVPVCPYCNMNYTISYNKNGEVKSTADLDHFYPKSRFPYYALCLYNFVPACSVCNSRLKLDSKTTRETYIFPNEESFRDKADFEIENPLAEKCTIRLNNYSNDLRVNHSIDLFQLEKRYEFFSWFATEMYEKVKKYNDSYREELKKMILNEIDIKKMIFGANKGEEEYAKESLGKLRMDLLKQLGVYD